MSSIFDNEYGKRNQVISKEKSIPLRTIKLGDIDVVSNKPLLIDLNNKKELIDTKHCSLIEYGRGNKPDYQRLRSTYQFEERMIKTYSKYVLIRFDLYPDRDYLNVTDNDYFKFISKLAKRIDNNIIYSSIILGFNYDLETSTTGKDHLHIYMYLDASRYTGMEYEKGSNFYLSDVYLIRVLIDSILKSFYSDISMVYVNCIDMSVTGSGLDLIVVDDKIDNIQIRNAARYILAYICKRSDNTLCSDTKGRKRFGNHMTKRNIENLIDISDDRPWYVKIGRLLTIRDARIIQDIEKIEIHYNRLIDAFGLEEYNILTNKEYVVLAISMSGDSAVVNPETYTKWLNRFNTVRFKNTEFNNYYLNYCWAMSLENNKWILTWFLFFKGSSDVSKMVYNMVGTIRNWIDNYSPLSVCDITYPNVYDYDQNSIITKSNYIERNKVRIALAKLTILNSTTMGHLKENKNVKLYSSSQYKLPEEL